MDLGNGHFFTQGGPLTVDFTCKKSLSLVITLPLLLQRILQESTQVSDWNSPRIFLDFSGSLRRFILITANHSVLASLTSDEY